MLLCVWVLIAKTFDQVCFDEHPETAMCILVKGHALWGWLVYSINPSSVEVCIHLYARYLTFM